MATTVTVVSYGPPVGGTGDATLTTGQSADIALDDTGTNTSATIFTLTHTTSGTAAAGFGLATLMKLENAGGTTVTAARITAVLTTATAASETAAVRIGLISGGTAIPAEGSEQFLFKPAALQLPYATSSSIANVAFGPNQEGFSCPNDGDLYMRMGGGVAIHWTTSSQIHADGYNFDFGTTNGTKIGQATNRKIGFWNVTPVIQYATTGTTTGFTANASANAVYNESTFTGNTGSTAYGIGDIVKALKSCGIMTA